MSSPHSQFPRGNRSRDFFGLGFDPLADPVAYPCLNASELAEVVPFGERCAIAENDPLVSAGDYPFNSFVILSGTVRAVDVSTGERVVFARCGAGYFTGDIDLFLHGDPRSSRSKPKPALKRFDSHRSSCGKTKRASFRPIIPFLAG